MAKKFPIAGGSGGGYDAVAFQMILGNANTASVEGGWIMADQREVIDQLLANLTQITVTPKTLDTLAADATAMSAVAASETAMSAVAASETAMSAVVASATAMSTVLASQSARHEIWGSDVALDAIIASETAHNAARAAGTLHSKAANPAVIDFTTGVTGGNLSSTGKYLILGVSWDRSSTGNLSLATARSGTSRPVSGAWLSGADASAGFDVAAPIEGPTITADVGFSVSNPVYLRVLDCTPPA